MPRNSYWDSVSWEDSKRSRDARHRRIKDVVNSMSEDYFRCLDCGRFCEDTDKSIEADVCFKCCDDTNNLPSEENDA